jgi:hypothetical protein
MTIESDALFRRVADRLRAAAVPFALIGASAMGRHGVSRSTLDIDLLVVDAQVLTTDFWPSFQPPHEVDIRTGDSDDPLAGVIRFKSPGSRDVDLVVGRAAWQRDILARARPLSSSGADEPVASVADLILLKLYAGGSQDCWDIEQLLAIAGPDVSEDVASEIPRLPKAAQLLWERLRTEGDK